MVVKTPESESKSRSECFMSSHSQSETPPWLTRGILLLLFLAAANLLAWRSVEPDLWGHIQYGEDWLHSGQMPRTATHTYSTPEHSWINHENLFELSVAFGHRIVGGLGLMLGKCIAGVWLLWIMIRIALGREVPLLAAAAAMIPTAWGLSEFWLARPQLFSFICFGLMLCAFERAFKNWPDGCKINRRWLWLCVPLMTVWTNSHGGFLAGLCVLLAMLGLRAFECGVKLGTRSVRTVLEFIAIGIAAVFSVLVNPYGYELPYWILVSLSVPRPEVSEWASILDGGVTAIPFAALALLTIMSLLWTRRNRDWVELIILALIAVQTIGHVRHLAFFAIAFGFWMPQHLLSLWHRLVDWRPTLGTHQQLSISAAKWLRVELGAVALVLAALLTHSFATFGVDRSKYPVSAIEFMTRERLHGKLVVTFDWAQYALAALTPATVVGFDGRYDTCYPQAVVDMNFDLLFGPDVSRRYRGADSGPVDPDRVLEFGAPDLVLLDRVADAWAVAHLDQKTDWVALYSDGRAKLWGRRSVYDDPDSAQFFAHSRRQISDLEQRGIAEWPGFPHRAGRNAFSPDNAAAAQNFARASSDLTLHAVRDQR
jgi:hypothetical protein